MPASPDFGHKTPSNTRSATMLGGSRSPLVASGLDDVGSEKFQPPEREGRLESSAPGDTLRNSGATTNSDVGTVRPIPLKVPQVKLVKDIIPRTASPKPAGCTTNKDDGTDAPISPKVSCVKLVKDITLQMGTLKPAGAAANADDGTALPKIPQLKLVKDITSQIITPKSASAAANSDYGTTVPTPLKMPQLKLVKDITLHAATPMTANTAEKAVQQKKRKANNNIGEIPVARLKLNIDDIPPGLSVGSSESSTLCCFSKAVLMDNLRSLTKLELDDEAPGMLPTSSENTTHFLSRAMLMDNLRALAKNHNLSDVSINDSNLKRSKEIEHE